MSFHKHSQRSDFRRLITFLTEMFLSGRARSSYQSSRCFEWKNVSTPAQDAEYSPPAFIDKRIKTIHKKQVVLKAMRMPENVRQFNISRIKFSIRTFSCVRSNRSLTKGGKTFECDDADGCKLRPHFQWNSPDVKMNWINSFRAFFIFDLRATVEIMQTTGDSGATSAPTWHRSVSGGSPSPDDAPRPLILKFKSRSCRSRKILL